MNRGQLQHVLRAAGAIVELSDLVVIGSQAILATYPEWVLPHEAMMSVEADLAVDAIIARVDLAVDESALADRIDGAIGEGSFFHQTHGYYAQGVETATAVLTEGWRERLVPMVCEDAEPKVVGWCLDRHDLWVAKAAAGRDKDTSFCRALAQAGLVQQRACRTGVDLIAEPYRRRARAVLASSF
jgi:hypothetical protein